MKNIYNSFVIIALLSGLFSCQFSRNINNSSEMFESNNSRFTIYTNGGEIYKVSLVDYTDSTLQCIGKVDKGVNDSMFSGTILIKDIKYVQSSESNFFKSLVAAGAIGFVGVTVASSLSSDINFTQKIIYPQGKGKGSGGSCPFVYNWNGEKFVLSGEAFSIALGKALEYTTNTLLTNPVEKDGIIKVKITNERPETHYFNSIELCAYETEKGQTILFDKDNIAYQVNKPVKSVHSFDRFGKDISTEIVNEDGMYWQSDLKTANAAYDFVDEIFLTFDNKAKQNEGLIGIKAINTEISDVVFSGLNSILGNDYLSFVNASENDTEMIKLLRNYQYESSMKASVWTGNSWKEIGLIFPEANMVPFKRVIKFKIDDLKNDKIKIKLTFMTDVWKVDGVELYTSKTEVVSPVKTSRMSFKNNLGISNNDNISKIDNKYLCLLPGNYMEFDFSPVKAAKNKDVFYALVSTGYLYEWCNNFNSQLIIPAFNGMSGKSKIEYIKELIKNKNFFLPLVYNEWSKLKKTK